MRECRKPLARKVIVGKQLHGLFQNRAGHIVLSRAPQQMRQRHPVARNAGGTFDRPALKGDSFRKVLRTTGEDPGREYHSSIPVGKPRDEPARQIHNRWT